MLSKIDILNIIDIQIDYEYNAYYITIRRENYPPLCKIIDVHDNPNFHDTIIQQYKEKQKEQQERVITILVNGKEVLKLQGGIKIIK